MTDYEEFQNKNLDPNRIKARKISGFLIHLFWFILINIILYILDYSQNGRIDYAYWTTFGWGIGIISHAFGVFMGANLEDNIYKRLNK